MITAVLAGQAQPDVARRCGVSQGWLSKVTRNSSRDPCRRGKQRMGRTDAGNYATVLIQELDVTIINAATGEILRELMIDLNRDYQPVGTKK